MTTKIIYKTIMFLVLVYSMQPLAAQTCIKGDCKNGFGVIRNGSGSAFSYHIGNFNKKGNLEGKAVTMSWSNANQYNEAEFLFALSQVQGIPPIEKFLDFKPSFIKTGNFVNGLLEGPGVMLMNNIDYFPSIAWIPEKWFKNSNIKLIKYEGNFFNSIVQKAGVVTFIYPNDTLICASDDLYQNNLYQQVDMVIDIRRKNVLQNQLIRANFINKKMHGWAVNSVPKPGTTENLFYRQLWFYGKLIHQDNGKAYPFDINDSKTIQDERDYEVNGPVINGKVNGFGSIRFGNNYVYEGYITNNQPDGYGFVKANGNEKYGLFKAGSFEQGTWLSWNFFLEIEEGRTDNFKEGFVSRSIYENLQAYIDQKKPRQSWSGYKIGENGWQGKVVNTSFNETNEYWYDKGIIVSSSTSYDQLMAFQVYAKDGIASMIVSYNAETKEGKLSDGRVITPGNKNEYKVSKHYAGEFYNVCICGGDGQGYMTAEVAGSTSSWTRTEQVNKSAVVGYWQGTQQVKSTYYTPGYTITRKVACNRQNAFWAPFGTTTRHSELTNKSLKE
jgi:hypothetical protein